MARAPKPAGWYVLSRLEHDGKVYEAGDSIALADEIAEPLAALGVVSAVPPQADAAPEDEAPLEG